MQRHIPKVARAISKIVSNLESIGKVVEYIQIMGKLHYQNGIKVRVPQLLGF